MVHELTTERVLTMEWLEGARLRSAGDSPSAGRLLQNEDMRLVGVRHFKIRTHRAQNIDIILPQWSMNSRNVCTVDS